MQNELDRRLCLHALLRVACVNVLRSPHALPTLRTSTVALLARSAAIYEQKASCRSPRTNENKARALH